MEFIPNNIPIKINFISLNGNILVTFIIRLEDYIEENTDLRFDIYNLCNAADEYSYKVGKYYNFNILGFHYDLGYEHYKWTFHISDSTTLLCKDEELHQYIIKNEENYSLTITAIRNSLI